MDDFRTKPPTKLKGVAFLCTFNPRRLLVGYAGKLWRLETLFYGESDSAWPWACNPRHLRLWLCSLRDWRSATHLLTFRVVEKKHSGGYWDTVHQQGIMENIHHILIRLQRWSRRMLHRRRSLALCMALHPRLGTKSPIADLGEDILPHILRQQPYQPIHSSPRAS